MLSRRDALMIGCGSGVAVTAIMVRRAIVNASPTQPSPAASEPEPDEAERAIDMPSYNWDLIASNANIPQADAVAHCTHPNGNMFMWGGVYTVPPSPWKALYRANVSAPAAWTNLGDLPCTQSHLAKLVVHSDGRIYKVGGDHFNPASQGEFWSIDENGGDFEMITTAAPWAGCGAEMHAASLGGYIHVWAGQSIGVSPAVFNTKHWRWSRAGGFELITDYMVSGARGMVSNTPVVGGKACMIGGGSFETDGWQRQTRNDIMTMDENGTVELVNARVSWLNTLWHSAENWDSNLWSMFGHNGAVGSTGDLNTVRRSPDLGKTWVQEANFPGTPRHAAAIFAMPQGILVGTGSHYGKDLYLLSKDAYTYTAPQNGTTSWGTTYTVVDDQAAIGANETIASLQIKLSAAQSVTFKIVRKNSNSSFTTVYTSGAFPHPGGAGGVYAGPTPNFTTPNDGATYRAAITYNPPGAEVFANGTYNRSQAPGDLGSVVGSTFTVAAQTDGTICMRWA